MKTKAIYSGTFDPFTKGHLCILKKGLKLYDEIIIAVAKAESKNPMLNINTRLRLIQNVTKDIKGATIISFDGLLINLLKEKKVYNVIRGLRDSKDFEYEVQMNYANKSLEKKVETIFLVPHSKYNYISSSLVRELIKFNTKVKYLLPKKIYKLMKKEKLCM